MSAGERLAATRPLSELEELQAQGNPGYRRRGRFLEELECQPRLTRARGESKSKAPRELPAWSSWQCPSTVRELELESQAKSKTPDRDGGDTAGELLADPSTSRSSSSSRLPRNGEAPASLPEVFLIVPSAGACRSLPAPTLSPEGGALQRPEERREASSRVRHSSTSSSSPAVRAVPALNRNRIGEQLVTATTSRTRRNSRRKRPLDLSSSRGATTAPKQSDGNRSPTRTNPGLSHSQHKRRQDDETQRPSSCGRS